VLETGEMNKKHSCRAQSNTVFLPAPLNIQEKNYPTVQHSVSNAMGKAMHCTTRVTTYICYMNCCHNTGILNSVFFKFLNYSVTLARYRPTS